MPFVDRNGAPLAPETMTAQVPYGVGDPNAGGDAPGFLETGAANFRLNNWLVSAGASYRGFSRPEMDPNYDPWKAIEGTPYEKHWDRFVDARNGADYENIKADIDAEDQARDVLARSGTFANLATGLAAGIADPLTLIPAAGVARNAAMGVSIAKTALLAGASTMAQASIQEALLHASQETRTLEESTWNVLGAGVVGTILGAGFAKVLSHAELSSLGGKLMDDMHAGPSGNPDAEALRGTLAAVNDNVTRATAEAEKATAGGAQSAGSAATPIPSMSELGVSGKTAAALVRMAPFSPIVRSLNWASPVARSLMFRLAENSVYLNGTEIGKTTGPAVENLIHQWTRGRLPQVIESHLSAYKDYVKNGGRMTRSEFNDAVGKAMRREDVSADNPFVERSAKLIRQQLFDPLTQRAVKNGLLPADIKTTTAPSYFSRVWNRKKLEAEEFDFKNTVKEYYRSVAGDMRKKVDSDAEFESDLDDIADNVYNKLTGRGGDFTPDFGHITVASRGPLKERTFNIPDRVIERWLDSDAERVMSRFTRIMSADVEIAERFPDSVDLGTKRVTLNGPLKEVRADYAKLRAQAKDDPKALARLNKEEDRATKDIAAVRDLLRGTYAQDLNNTNFAKIARTAQTFNFVRNMGDVVKSSLTDIARAMVVHGVGPYFKGMGEFITNPAFRAISKQEAKLAGVVGDTVLHARLASWADMTDPHSAQTPFERFVANSGRIAAKASGIALWNDFQRSFAASMTETRLVKNILKGWSKLPDKDRRYMAYLGIDEGMAERMRFQMEPSTQAGKDEHGFWHSGTESWGDNEAKRTFHAAIDKDVNSIIVTPGVADVPLFSRTPLGGTLLQYKSYVIASHQKALIRAVQEGANGQALGVLLGTMSMVSIGMFISVLTAIETNRVDDLAKRDNPGAWLAEGIDRSGMASLLMEANNASERFGGPGLYGGLERLFPEGEQGGLSSRFSAREPLSVIGGPSAGTAEDIARIWGWTWNEDRKPTGAKALLTLLPGRTLPYVRPFMEYGLRPQLDDAGQ